jgi:phenylpropionate dioxygenase-like ring-hydroxylating dioxygenase large terminal subunit
MNATVLRYFHPVLPSRELERRPRRVEVGGHPIVLFRSVQGTASALDDQCPHRRASLSAGVVRTDGRLSCGYHGWHFDAEGRGQSPSCPELRHCDTRAWQAVERFGFIWLADRDAQTEPFPLEQPAGFSFAGSFRTQFDAPMELALDNITEDEHFAFVHSTFGWSPTDAAKVLVRADVFPDRTEVHYEGPQRGSWFGPLGGVRKGDVFHNHWMTTFEPVKTAYTFGWRDKLTGADRPILTRAVVFLLPENQASTSVQMFVFVRIAPSIQASFAPLFRSMAVRVARMELRRDAAFVKHVANAATDLQGMRLSRHDKALIRNRELLSTIYWNRDAGRKRAPGAA